MIAGLLFIIAGLLFTLTGVGAIIGIPMILLGFLLIARTCAHSMGRQGAIAFIVLLIFVAWYQKAHADEFSQQGQSQHAENLAPYIISLHECMKAHAGVRGDAIKNIVAKHGNPLVHLTDKCPSQVVAFVVACEADGFSTAKCDAVVVGDAMDIVDAFMPPI